MGSLVEVLSECLRNHSVFNSDHVASMKSCKQKHVDNFPFIYMNISENTSNELAIRLHARSFRKSLNERLRVTFLSF